MSGQANYKKRPNPAEELQQAESQAKALLPTHPMYFVDIETVPTYQEIPVNELGKLFIDRIRRDDNFVNEVATWKEKAAFHAEFGKIVCLSIGKLHDGKFYIKTFASKFEEQLLIKAGEAIAKATMICGHNSIEFDFPYWFRRCIVNKVPIPGILSVLGKKKWDVPHFDTMEMWAHNQWKYKASLDLLARIFEIQSPKADMNGSMVAEIYYSMFETEEGQLPMDKEEQVLKRIAKYCGGDVFTDANVYFRMKGLEPISADIISEEIIII